MCICVSEFVHICESVCMYVFVNVSICECMCICVSGVGWGCVSVTFSRVVLILIPKSEQGFGPQDNPPL